MFEMNLEIGTLLDFYGDLLPEERRRLLAAYYFDDLSLAETAEIFSMTRQGVRELGTEGLDLVVLENVGNLVCPAEFDTGAAKNAVIGDYVTAMTVQNAQVKSEADLRISVKNHTTWGITAIAVIAVVCICIGAVIRRYGRR